jgi:hypothetical protein
VSRERQNKTIRQVRKKGGRHEAGNLNECKIADALTENRSYSTSPIDVNMDNRRSCGEVE